MINRFKYTIISKNKQKDMIMDSMSDKASDSDNFTSPESQTERRKIIIKRIILVVLGCMFLLIAVYNIKSLSNWFSSAV